MWLGKMEELFSGTEDQWNRWIKRNCDALYYYGALYG